MVGAVNSNNCKSFIDFIHEELNPSLIKGRKVEKGLTSEISYFVFDCPICGGLQSAQTQRDCLSDSDLYGLNMFKCSRKGCFAIGHVEDITPAYINSAYRTHGESLLPVKFINTSWNKKREDNRNSTKEGSILKPLLNGLAGYGHKEDNPAYHKLVFAFDNSKSLKAKGGFVDLRSLAEDLDLDEAFVLSVAYKYSKKKTGFLRKRFYVENIDCGEFGAVPILKRRRWDWIPGIA